MKLHPLRNATGQPYNYKTLLWLDLVILLLAAVISYTTPLPFPWKMPLIAAMLTGYIYAYHRLSGITPSPFMREQYAKNP